MRSVSLFEVPNLRRKDHCSSVTISFSVNAKKKKDSEALQLPLVLPLRQSPIRFCVGYPDGLTSNSWRFWVHQSSIYIACRDNFQEAKVSLHPSGQWRMGFTEQGIKKYPWIPADRNRAWDIWPEPSPQLPQTVVAFKLVFPNSELVITPEQRTSKLWKKVVYVDIWKQLPPNWMTVVTLFVTTGDLHLRHERGPSFWVASLDIGQGRYAQLVAHGDPEGDIHEVIGKNIARVRAQAEQVGAKVPPAGYAYMLGIQDEGIRYIVSGRVNR
jgi:hypothetical protein